IVFLSALAMAQTAPPPIVFPIIEQPLVPTAAQPGGAGFTLTINGVGFYPQPTAVLWREGTNAPVQLTITSVNAKGTQLPRRCRWQTLPLRGPLRYRCRPTSAISSSTPTWNFFRLRPRHLRYSPVPCFTEPGVRPRACWPQTSMAMGFWT